MNNKETAVKWEVIPHINAPCADISYQWISERNGQLAITMHFSRVIRGFEKDVVITFCRPMALQWEEESFGLVRLPDELPQCKSGQFPQWTYPLLMVSNSQWAHQYAEHFCTEAELQQGHVRHYVFISMNDLVHVLSAVKPAVMLVNSKD